MDRWQAMRIFVQVVESGGFAPAAKVLHMSPPSVTRAVAKLEDLIGTRLLVRTTRSLKLTAAGEGYVAIAGVSSGKSPRRKPMRLAVSPLRRGCSR